MSEGLRILLTALIVIAFIFAVILDIYYRDKEKSRRSGWLETRGIVLSSEEEYEPSAERGPAYTTSMSFEYEVNGQKHTGSQTWGSDISRLGKYAKGARIAVHYNPANPREALVEETYTIKLRFVAVLVFFVGLIGLSLIWGWW